MSAALMTQLGAALGCAAKRGTPDVDPDAKIDGFPARCWYVGPLITPSAPRPKVQLEAMTMMDLEAREMAERGRLDIIRFARMMRRERDARRPK